MKMDLRTIADVLLDTLMPRRCMYCNKVIGFGECRKCKEDAPKVTRFIGLPLQRQQRSFSCVTTAYAPFWYEYPVRVPILEMKYGEGFHLYDFYVDRMARTYYADSGHITPTLLVPVPHLGAEESLAEVLTDGLQTWFDLPMRTDILYKTRETQPQKELSGQARRKNLKDAFAVREPQEVEGQHVLIIDDVITTGTTVNECARALLAAGAADCCVLAAAAVKR